MEKVILVCLVLVFLEFLKFAVSCVCERAECFLLKILICSEPNMGFQNSTAPPPFVIAENPEARVLHHTRASGYSAITTALGTRLFVIVSVSHDLKKFLLVRPRNPQQNSPFMLQLYAEVINIDVMVVA